MLLFFAFLYEKYRAKWTEEKEKREWEEWEEGERMREGMGHTTDFIKISRSSRPPRKKHRH